MEDKKIKSEVNKSSMNPVIAAMAGAVVAGVTVAGAMIMSDKKNQAKVGKAVSDVKDNLNNKKASVVDKANKLGVITKNAVKEAKSI